MRNAITRYLVEAILGFVIAALVLWVAFATVESVPFVYQGF